MPLIDSVSHKVFFTRYNWGWELMWMCWINFAWLTDWCTFYIVQKKQYVEDKVMNEPSDKMAEAVDVQQLTEYKEVSAVVQVGAQEMFM